MDYAEAFYYWVSHLRNRCLLFKQMKKVGRGIEKSGDKEFEKGFADNSG